jgi:flagellar hook-basal body complex protein FliE
MSPRARTTAPKRSGSTTRRASTAKRGKGHTALDRLTKSVDAAQDALKDLRGEMGKGGSGILKDVDKQLKDARKSLRTHSKSVLKDLEGLQEKLPGVGGAKKSSSSRKSTSSRSSTARKASSASRSTARKASTAGKSTARKAAPRARASAPRARAAQK